MKREWTLLVVAMTIMALLLSGCAVVGPAAQTVASTIAANAPTDTHTATPTAESSETILSPETAVDIASMEQAFVNIYEHVNPSVVNIQVVIQPDTTGDSQTTPFPELPPGFEFPPFQFQPPETGPQTALGSGFVYDKKGHIITNNHVVANADKITVIFADDTEASATLVGTDPDSDLAVIKVDVDPEKLVPVQFGDSDALKVGQIVVAIGNPFGLEGSMTTGIVSGLGRLLPAGAVTPSGQRFSIPDVIQTDAAINPGNSGGPLLNLKGEVIGVNTAITSPVRGSSGIGYAVPSNIVTQVVPELIEKGHVEHPWLGISGTTLSAELAEAMGLDHDQRGVLVVEVVANSPADKADLRGSDTQVTIDGLQARVGGDVIVGIDEHPVEEFDDLLAYIVRETKVGQTVVLDILRDGEPMQVEVTLEARPTANNE